MYALENIGFAYGPKTVIDDVSLTFEAGHFYGIIGPNGCGKTTLIDLLTGRLQPYRGRLRFNGQPLAAYSPRELARCIALVPQDFRIDFPYTCEEIVMMGRHPHIARFGRPGERDRSLVAAAMRRVRLEEIGGRCVTRLSGGERQRVVFARGLAQDAPVLLLDEATSNLDMRYALDLLNLAAGRVGRRSLVIAVLQDINLAALYCDRLICMQAGGIYAAGPLEEILTADMLQKVFRVNVQVVRNEDTGCLQVAFRREVSA